MSLDASVLNSLIKGSPRDAWEVIINKALEISSKPITQINVSSEVLKRDLEIGLFDYFLSSSGWDLWQEFGNVVERTSDKLVKWWSQPYSAKAVLILDGLSLRELPWLLQGAKERGFIVHDVTANASELPGETNEFARALGFGSRSQLQNNGGGISHRLQSTETECVDMPWADCEGLINASPNWVFWHHWPDSKLHDGAVAGQGLDTLTPNVVSQLNSDDFWSFVERLAIGRRLVITSDHGYAASGYFPDAEAEVGHFLKNTFSSGRSKSGIGDSGPFVPPVALQVISPHGENIMVVGRWKWRSQGGYPTLTHGGLSILEVLSPFIEITK